MLIFGALPMVVCHLTFAIGLPALRGNDLSMTNTESIISGTIKEIKGDSDSQADPIVTDVVFRPAHFYNPEIAQAVSGQNSRRQ